MRENPREVTRRHRGMGLGDPVGGGRGAARTEGTAGAGVTAARDTHAEPRARMRSRTCPRSPPTPARCGRSVPAVLPPGRPRVQRPPPRPPPPPPPPPGPARGAAPEEAPRRPRRRSAPPAPAPRALRSASPPPRGRQVQLPELRCPLPPPLRAPAPLTCGPARPVPYLLRAPRFPSRAGPGRGPAAPGGAGAGVGAALSAERGAFIGSGS